MIICYRCGKENQDHYKFCLGCGAELTAAPKGEQRNEDANMAVMNTVMSDSRPSPTPPGGMRASPPPPAPYPASYGAPPPMAPPPGVPASAAGVRAPAGIGAVPGPSGASGRGGEPPQGPRTCGSCGSTVPPEFKFCGVCGAKMEPLPAAPPAQPRPTHDSASVAGSLPVMVLIRPDGTEGGIHGLREGENPIGRSHGEIFENDGYLSPTHAALVVRGGEAVIRDLGSLNGVFVKMTEDEELEHGQVIRIGQELLRFDFIEPPQPLPDGTEVMGSPNPGYWGKVTVIIGNGVDGSTYPLLNESINLGRERGEINFPEDGYVSGLHARLTNQGGKVYLSDLGSSNGTFIRVHGERTLGHGAFVLLGQQLFRLALRA